MVAERPLGGYVSLFIREFTGILSRQDSKIKNLKR